MMNISDITIEMNFGSSRVVFNRSLDESIKGFVTGEYIIITDKKIQSHYSDILNKHSVILIPESDEAKTFEHITNCSVQLIERGLGRDVTLIAFGGGAVCDFTGFLASIYKRGVDFALIPTTLLSQVDASIGGKNGINIGDYKNMLGVFAAPKFININASYSLTQDDSDWTDGFAEIVKHACIADEIFFQWLLVNNKELRNKNLDLLNQCIAKAAEIKIKIVEEDSLETGLRKTLNFGHTIGHAIEKHYQLSHGKAVSIGMLVEVKVAHKMGTLSFPELVSIAELLEYFGLPTKLEIDWEAIWDIMMADKKRQKDNIDWIVLDRIGHARVINMPISDIKELILSLYV